MMKIVAEVGSNWQTDEDCIKSVELAKEAGADAVKFQFYGVTDLYGNAAKQVKQMPPLHQLGVACRSSDIELMCTFFSPLGVEMFDPLIKTHKIASAEMEYKDLIAAVLETNKPFYLSTGGHTLKEVEQILRWMDLPTDDQRLTLMYCESVYPARQTDMTKIKLLGEFGYPVGLSDHSTEIYSTTHLALIYGCTVIERHVNLVGVTGTPDADHSLSFDELVQLDKFVGGVIADDILSPEEQPMRDRHNRRETNGGFYRLP
jgi:N-acetylneuraminate synthase